MENPMEDIKGTIRGADIRRDHTWEHLFPLARTPLELQLRILNPQERNVLGTTGSHRRQDHSQIQNGSNVSGLRYPQFLRYYTEILRLQAICLGGRLCPRGTDPNLPTASTFLCLTPSRIQLQPLPEQAFWELGASEPSLSSLSVC